jgi:hypothetical protein
LYRIGHWSTRKSLIVSVVESSPPYNSVSSARIYRPSFGHEKARFRENMPKTLVFNSICTQRRRFQLVLNEIDLRVVFKYWDCVEEEISWFSPSPPPPIPLPPPGLLSKQTNNYSVYVVYTVCPAQCRCKKIFNMRIIKSICKCEMIFEMYSMFVYMLKS